MLNLNLNIILVHITSNSAKVNHDTIDIAILIEN